MADFDNQTSIQNADDATKEQEMIQEVQKFLDAMAVQERMIERSRLEHENIVNEIKSRIPSEIIANLEQEEKAYQIISQGYSENLIALKETIVNQVLLLQTTVKGKERMAVWAKGRTTWDGKLLEGMSKLIPQLNEARKIGEPTVSFREVK